MLLLFCYCCPVTAQLPPIQTDRPDQTECPFITPVNYIQVENGFLYERAQGGAETYTYPSALWKYGLNDHFECRLITTVQSETAGGIATTGLSPITVGFKASLCKEKGIIPLTSFIGHITTSNWGSKTFHTPHIAPSFRFTMQHTLTDKMVLAYNLGTEWDGVTPVPVYLYTLTTGFSLTDKLGGYVELYGYSPQDKRPDHRVDGGLNYLLNNDLLLDVSGGFGLPGSALDHYIALGLSYRFRVK